ncbi:MAG TPA: type II toxin-antitoxin system VapC family toxin [Dermatophilaceae bacterium]|nr:type II toxin-antitoxin system VapC family toxin [Dermatophilaceae bacterium]
MKALVLDPSVLLLAVGGPHPQRDPCRAVVRAASEGRARLPLSVAGGQELLLHRLRRTSRATAVRELDLVEAIVDWHDFDRAVLSRSRDLVAAGQARGRDAVHAATALRAGFGSIVSCDADFDGIPGLTRTDPTHDRVV